MQPDAAPSSTLGVATRVERVLEMVLAGAPDINGSGLRVLDSWIESEDVFCLVYTSDWDVGVDGPLGLRRTLDDGWTPEQVAEYVLLNELGEPLGTLADELVERDGVWWFTGDHVEWRVPLS
ncbi:hypothetical protein [Nocardioides sp.]|uniref:hypothetical protein n=1 Tax=Nocardioides sp. TaxID=35761 RepID=UPI003516D6D3